MTPDDLPQFSILMGTLEAAYRVRFGPDTTRVYWMGLQSLPWHEVSAAVGKAIQTCTKVPTVAAIRSLISTGRVDVKRQGRTGTYPPDVARKRREYGLPVTPEEHVAYDRGEMREPRVTRAQMIATLRDVAAKDRRGDFSPTGESGRVAWMDTLADDMERRLKGDATPMKRTGNIFADAFISIAESVVDTAREREPGEDG